MAEQPIIGSVAGRAGDDSVRPFQVEGLDVRGRAVQMGPALDALLGRHDYPTPVSKLVAEAVVLVTLLGSSLKFEGRLIFQTKTDGPVSLLVVDFKTPGDLRAYARFNAEAVAAAEKSGTATPGLLLGKGVLALTIDQGDDMQRYQGVVALEGNSLEEVAHTYFRQSEQIPTRIRLAVAELMVREDGKARRHWRAGGILAQFMPTAPDRMRQRDLPGGDAPDDALIEDDAEDDAWREAQSLVGTVEDRELVDSDIPVERLLFRLFHERGVRVFEPTPVHDRCNCNEDRIRGMLRSFSAQQIEDSVEGGRIRVTCEFCGKHYDFEPDEFRSRFNADGTVKDDADPADLASPDDDGAEPPPARPDD